MIKINDQTIGWILVNFEGILDWIYGIFLHFNAVAEEKKQRGLIPLKGIDAPALKKGFWVENESGGINPSQGNRSFLAFLFGHTNEGRKGAMPLQGIDPLPFILAFSTMRNNRRGGHRCP